jgi:prepilin-type N-terminal cleavage/methylation domain-containing protein
MRSFRQRTDKGFTAVETLIVVAIIGVLSMTAIANLAGAQRQTRYARAVSDAKNGVSQAMAYAAERKVYPTSIQEMRDAGLTNLCDVDPWGNAYILSPVLTGGLSPEPGDDVYIYSKGASSLGAYPVPFMPNTGHGGSVGYSTLYGSFTGV